LKDKNELVVFFDYNMLLVAIMLSLLASYYS